MTEAFPKFLPPQSPRYRGDEENNLKELEPRQREVLEMQLADYQALNEIDLQSHLRDRLATGDTSLPAGTLIHGVGFTPEVVEGIAHHGVVSGELVGKGEYGETHYCADFFRIEGDTTVAQYCEDITGKEPGSRFKNRVESEYVPNRRENSQNLIGVIVDPTVPEVQSLLEADAFREGTEELLEGIIGALPAAKDSPLANRLSAILVGMPKGAIAGIIVGSAVAADAEKVGLINRAFHGKVPLVSIAGQLI